MRLPTTSSGNGGAKNCYSWPNFWGDSTVGNSGLIRFPRQVEDPMRASRLVAFSCFIAAGCKAETSGGPTTSHRLAGTWSYDMPVLQDGHGLNCSIMGPV